MEGSESKLYTDSPAFPGYGWLIYQVCFAYDRYQAYLKAKDQTEKGKLVICNRFPLPQIKFMDGQQVNRTTASYPKNWLINFLAKLECTYYQRIVPPDLVVVLVVDPEVAVIRKLRASSPEFPYAIRNCTEEIRTVDWRNLSVYKVDANRSSGEIISDLRAILLWKYL